jgi:hypothetical protein
MISTLICIVILTGLQICLKIMPAGTGLSGIQCIELHSRNKLNT